MFIESIAVKFHLQDERPNITCCLVQRVENVANTATLSFFCLSTTILFFATALVSYSSINYPSLALRFFGTYDPFGSAQLYIQTLRPHIRAATGGAEYSLLCLNRISNGF